MGKILENNTCHPRCPHFTTVENGTEIPNGICKLDDSPLDYNDGYAITNACYDIKYNEASESDKEYFLKKLYRAMNISGGE